MSKKKKLIWWFGKIELITDNQKLVFGIQEGQNGFFDVICTGKHLLHCISL